MPTVELEVTDHIAAVTINRPQQRNALSPEVLILLADIWDRVASDADIRVAMITGAGETAFCAGADLGLLIPLITGDREPVDDFDRAYLADPGVGQKALLRTFDPGKPVIAAVNGTAIAGGLELMLACDLRVAADGARLGLQEAKWGLFPLGGATARLPREIPFAPAMELLLTGNLIDAGRAHALGLVNHVVPQWEVVSYARHLAGVIAANGPVAVQAIRASARAGLGRPTAEALDLELEIGMPIFATDDAREGPRAFMEKRKPHFEGR